MTATDLVTCPHCGRGQYYYYDNGQPNQQREAARAAYKQLVHAPDCPTLRNHQQQRTEARQAQRTLF